MFGSFIVLVVVFNNLIKKISKGGVRVMTSGIASNSRVDILGS